MIETRSLRERICELPSCAGDMVRWTGVLPRAITFRSPTVTCIAIPRVGFLMNDIVRVVTVPSPWPINISKLSEPSAEDAPESFRRTMDRGNDASASCSRISKSVVDASTTRLLPQNPIAHRTVRPLLSSARATLAISPEPRFVRLCKYCRSACLQGREPPLNSLIQLDYRVRSLHSDTKQNDVPA